MKQRTCQGVRDGLPLGGPGEVGYVIPKLVQYRSTYIAEYFRLRFLLCTDELHQVCIYPDVTTNRRVDSQRAPEY